MLRGMKRPEAKAARGETLDPTVRVV